MLRGVWRKVAEYVVADDLDGALGYVLSIMKSYDATDYHQVEDLEFSNTTHSIVDSINSFLVSSSKDIDIQALYLEMNGFYINTDRWFFDIFGYTSYNPDPADIEWLSDWQCSAKEDVILTGMESLQLVYDSHQSVEGKSKMWREIIELTDFVVTLKFMRLIRYSLQEHRIIKSIPILCTAHDYDIIYRRSPVSHSLE